VNCYPASISKADKRILPRDSTVAMDKLASLVPEIYYDLIGRIVPGLILCLVLFWNLRTELSFLKELGGGTVIAFVLLLGYAMGLILDLLAGMFLYRPNRIIFWALAKFAAKNNVWQVHVWQVIARQSDEARASHLRKMMAERAALRNLTVLSIALWLLGGWPMSRLPSAISTAAVIALVLAYYRMEFWVRYEAMSLNGKF
jgi:hypothetical protein